MRTLQPIERPAKKLTPFTHELIQNALFGPARATTTVKPFLPLHPSKLAQVSVTYHLRLFEDAVGNLDLLRCTLLALDQHPITDMEYLLKLPGWMINLLVASNTEIMRQWNDYIFDEMSEFAKTQQSKIRWTLMRHAGISSIFTGPLASEQKLWLITGDRVAAEEDRKFVLDIRESLLPWLNTELYQNYVKSKDKRENVNYAKQKREMVDGTFDTEALDIIR